jgi:hypothetical protein
MPIRINEDGSLPTVRDSNDGNRPKLAPDVLAVFEAVGGEHPDLATHTALGLSADDHTHAAGDHPDLAAHDTLGLVTDAILATHAGAADPHTGYQKESEKAAASGYASLDGTTKVPIAQLPTGTTGTTVALGNAAAGLITTHEGAADPHTGYLKENEANWTDLTDGGETALHTHAGGAGGVTMAEVIDALYPVGALYTSTLTTNPGTLLGRGTWTAFGAGRVLVGRDAGDADFDTAEETGGAKTKALSVHADASVADHAALAHSAHAGATVANHTDVLNHVHDEYRNSATTGGLDGWAAGDTSTNTATLTGYDTGNPTANGVAAQVHTVGQASAHSDHAAQAHTVGQASAHTDLNVVQPYIVVYMWKRTA